MKLFAIYVGGEMKGANIELHDMRFVMAESLKATHDELHRQWWGTPGTLHIDCWSELTQADGYKIILRREPSEDTGNKLFYINLGGYDSGEFTEMHKNMFVVAETEHKAKIRALKTVRHWKSFHKDDLFEAEQSFCINDAVNREWFIHLEKIDDESPAPFTCAYTRI